MVEELTVRHPRAQHALDEILTDHPAILGRLREILTGSLVYSEGKSPSDARLRRRITDLLDFLGKHEREETALIQSLEYRDFGGGD